MSVRYGTRAKGGTKSTLAARKRTANGDHSGAPKPRKCVSMLSDADLVKLVDTGRARDRSKFIKELNKRCIGVPVQVGQPIEATA